MVACRNRGIPLPAFGDAIAPGIVLAQAIGRLGNYFNQELYGRPTTVPWGLEIYEREGANGVVSPDLANGVSTGELYSVVHPTFLYELLWNVLIFAVLILLDRRFKIGHGRLFALYVAGYCLGRFWIELLRSDQATLIADIRVNSFTSTFVFIGAVVYIMVAPKGREDPETLKGKPRDESLIGEVADELVAVAATSGVVAAAKAASAVEEEAALAAAGRTLRRRFRSSRSRRKIRPSTRRPPPKPNCSRRPWLLTPKAPWTTRTLRPKVTLSLSVVWVLSRVRTLLKRRRLRLKSMRPRSRVPVRPRKSRRRWLLKTPRPTSRAKKRASTEGVVEGEDEVAPEAEEAEADAFVRRGFRTRCARRRR